MVPNGSFDIGPAEAGGPNAVRYAGSVRRVPIFIVIAAAIGGIVWWLFQGPKSAPAVIPATSAPATFAQPESVPEARPEVRKIMPTAFVESEPAGQPRSRAESAAVFRGRCVDAATGAPLAGCVADLHGWESNSQRVNEHVSKHGPVDWRDPDDVTTGADGRFEIRFSPPPPYQFLLSASRPGRANMEGRWFEVKPDAVIDVGDVKMQPGTTVKGRVVDAGGTPQPQMSVTFSSGERPARETLGPRAFFNMPSRADGTFAFASPVPAGTFQVEVRGNCRLVEPRTVEIAATETERFVEIKVSTDIDADVILGFVRDEQGTPVRGADIRVLPPGTDSRGMSRTITSAKDGSFRVQRVNQDPKQPALITATCSGYEDTAVPVRTTWGSKDVAVVVRRGLDVEVFVRDGDENKPLERYGVRCFPGPGMRGEMRAGSQVREMGLHPDGVVRLTGIRRGRHRLMVEPEGSWAASAIHEFEMTEAGAPRQEITVWRAVKKTVRVRKKDGTPVAGTKVDLVRPMGDESVDEATKAVSASELAMPYGRMAHAVDSGSTGADGTLELSGPPHERLLLRALGPGHAPSVREIDFATGEPIIDMVVASGATLAGRIVPLELLPQLDGRDDAADAPEERGRRTGVLLHKAGQEGRIGRQLEYPLGGFAAAAIGDDGAFRIECVPPGPWEVHLRYTESTGGRSSTISWHVIGSVDLADGEEHKRTFDLGYLLKAEVEGTVTLDGQPLEKGSITFDGSMAGPGGESKRILTQNRPIQPGGKFRASLWPAEYRMLAQFLREGRYQAMHDVNRFRVVAGQKLTVQLDLRSSLLKLRVLAPDGKTPVPGISLRVDVPNSEWPKSSKPTDAEGYAEVEGLPALEVAIRVFPKRLATFEARTAERSLRRDDDALITVKTLTITPPETSATIVLPASAGY